MGVKEVKKDVYSVGALDWDRQLFDELIPLPDGTSYNSYLVVGSEKTLLLDTVDPAKTSVLLENLRTLNIDKIDYVISHHTEQDHSGSIPTILEKYPEAKVVTNEKGKTLLKNHLLIADDKFLVISKGDTLSLGNKTLEFIMAPWVHWPETILSYLREDKILFSCDLFSSHLASDSLFVVDEPKVYMDAKRFYAEIMMPFRTTIKNHIKELDSYDIAMIAPSHGPVYNNPEFIINAYNEWTSDETKMRVLIPYVSMHGSTEKMVYHLLDALEKRKVPAIPFNLTITDIGKLALELVDASTIVIGTPTVLVGAHPAVVYGAFLVNALRPKLKYATVIGSYGWGGKAVEQLVGLLTNLKVELLEPVLAQGHPSEKDYISLDNLAEDILKRHN